MRRCGVKCHVPLLSELILQLRASQLPSFITVAASLTLPVLLSPVCSVCSSLDYTCLPRASLPAEQRVRPAVHQLRERTPTAAVHRGDVEGRAGGVRGRSETHTHISVLAECVLDAQPLPASLQPPTLCLIFCPTLLLLTRRLHSDIICTTAGHHVGAYPILQQRGGSGAHRGTGQGRGGCIPRSG